MVQNFILCTRQQYVRLNQEWMWLSVGISVFVTNSVVHLHSSHTLMWSIAVDFYFYGRVSNLYISMNRCSVQTDL